MHTDCLDFFGMFAIDVFYLSPSIKPVQGLICLPVVGHGGGPMQQVYSGSRLRSYDRVGDDKS